MKASLKKDCLCGFESSPQMKASMANTQVGGHWPISSPNHAHNIALSTSSGHCVLSIFEPTAKALTDQGGVY